VHHARQIADAVGAILLVDMAHFSGLVAAGIYPNPCIHADIVTSTTHKTLRGPRGGLILTRDAELGKKFDKAVFPGTQGGPLEHVIAGKAVAFWEALQPEFKTYSGQVIRNAQAKTMLELSKAVKVLAEKAKNKKLSPDDFSGGTITVSNLGAYGVDNFDAIINPRQEAILAIGSIRNAPVVSETGAIVAGQRMWVGMSCDHRVIDGAVGATFLQAFRKYVENPALMLV